MPIEYLKFGFTAGEIAPDLHGRTDLEGFAFGYREGLNVLPDWRGAIRTRPGTLFCEPLFEDSTQSHLTNPSDINVRFHDFNFNAEPEDNYLMILTHGKMYFVQDGQYLEGEIEEGAAPPALTGLQAVAYSNGTEVKISWDDIVYDRDILRFDYRYREGTNVPTSQAWLSARAASISGWKVISEAPPPPSVDPIGPAVAPNVSIAGPVTLSRNRAPNEDAEEPSTAPPPAPSTVQYSANLTGGVYDGTPEYVWEIADGGGSIDSDTGLFTPPAVTIFALIRVTVVVRGDGTTATAGSMAVSTASIAVHMEDLPGDSSEEQ